MFIKGGEAANLGNASMPPCGRVFRPDPTAKRFLPSGVQDGTQSFFGAAE
jgi:hypothetical protein